MNQRLKSKTYFNLAFIPLLFFIGYLGITIIEGSDGTHGTDRMFGERLDIAIFFLIALIIGCIVWFVSAIVNCIQTYSHKIWFTLNVISIIWLPLTIAVWLLKPQFISYQEEVAFQEKIEKQAGIINPSIINFPGDESILTSYIFQGNVYILTGQGLSRRESLESKHPQLLFCPTLREPEFYCKNLQVFKFEEDQFIEQNVTGHPLFDSIYHENIYNRINAHDTTIYGSIVLTTIQMKQPDQRCIFPFFMKNKTYLFHYCDSLEIKHFHNDFMPKGYRHISGHLAYKNLMKKPMTAFNKNFWNRRSFNFYYELPNEEIYCVVSPWRGKYRTTKTIFEDWESAKSKSYLYLAKKDDDFKVKKVGPISKPNSVKGLFVYKNKVYIVLTNRLLSIDTF